MLKFALAIIVCISMIFPTPLFQGNVSHAADFLASNISDRPVSDGNKDRLWHTFPVDETLPSTGQNASAHPWSQQAWLLGNGTLGTFMYGDPERERIHINDKTLWRGGRINPAQKDSSSSYDDGGNRTNVNKTTIGGLNAFRQLLDNKTTNVFGGAFTTINSQLNALMPGNNTPMGQYNDFANMYLEFPSIPEYDSDPTIKNSYVRSLNMDTGISYVNFDYNGTHYKRESFASHPDGVGVTQLTADKGNGKLDFNLFLANEEYNATYQTNVASSADTADGTVALQFDLAANQLHAAMQVKVLTDGTISSFTKASHRFPGTAGNNGLTKGPFNGLSISGATYATLVYATGTDYKNEYPQYRSGETKPQLLSRVAGKVGTAAAKGFASLESAHKDDFSSLYGRVEIDLDTNCPSIPTDRLVRDYRNGKYSRVMEEQEYQMGRYLTISGSRAGDPLPTNLCGLWMVGNGGTYWNADFHFNINVQMNYWPTMQANLAESMVPFNDYVESLVQPGRLTAMRSFVSNDPSYEDYDAAYDTGFYNLAQYPVGEGRGFVVNTTNNPYGFTAPNPAQEYGYNVGGSAWSLLNLYEYYQFTRDENFLENDLYPMLKEQAKFYDRYLWYSPYQDRLVVGPSVSAEHGPTVNGSTYDQSIAWQLYDMAIAVSKKLGVDAGLRAGWETKQKDLKPVNIGTQGQIKEWFEETRLGYAQAGSLPETPIPAWNPSLPGQHRHANHLFGLYPGTLITQDNPEYMDAAKVSLINRGFEATGWSKAWKLNMWARTGDAENTYKLLQSMNAGYFAGMLENLLDSHPPFQIDGNYGYTAGMQEMLMQSQNGYVEFLPTLPDEWATGSVKGFVARGNFEVDMDWSDGTANVFKIVSKKGNVFKGRYPGIADATVTEMRSDGANVKAIAPTKDGKDNISFPTTENKVYIISFNDSNTKLLQAIDAATALAGSMDDQWLSAPKGLLNGAIADARTVLAQVSANYTDAIKALNKSVNIAKGAVALCESARDAKGYQGSLKIGTLAWEYTADEKAAYGRAIQTAVDSLLMADGDTTADDYSAAATILAAETASVSVRTDALKVGFSWANNNVTMSKPYSITDIRYTLDGSEPTKYSNIYKAPISFNNGTTIKAALFHDGKKISDIAEYYYRHTPSNAFRTTTVATREAVGVSNPANAYDGSATTYSNAPSGSGQNTAESGCSITVKFATPVDVSSTRVFRSSANYWINKFRIEYSNDNGETWETAYSYNGPDTIPTDYFATFPKFTANMVRLNILEGWAVRVYEWELYDDIKPLNANKTSLNAVKAKYQQAVEAGAYPSTADESTTQKEAQFVDAFDYVKAIAASKYADQTSVDDAYSVANALVATLGIDQKTSESALTAAISAANSLYEFDYDSDVKIAEFKAALAKAKAVKADGSALQIEVDRALEALKAAQAEMEATAKNWSYLNGIITAAQEAAQDISEGKYLDVNVDKFSDALENALLVKSQQKSKQKDINAAAEALIKALGKLVLTGRDEILADVEYATGLYDRGIASLLSPDDLAAFEEAYENAVAVLYDPNATDGRISDAMDELEYICGELGLVEADKEALQKSVEDGKKLKAADYTDADLFASFTAALNAAAALLDDPDTLQVEADKAIAALQQAKAALGTKVKNSQALISAIAGYRKELADNRAKYVESDVRILESMIAKAEQMIAKGSATQAEIDDAVASLKDLRAMLRLSADKSALAKTLDKANKIVAKYYTKGSVAPFAGALSNAKVVNANANLSKSEQSIVDSANTQLNTAMGKLVYNVTKLKLSKKPKALKKGKTLQLKVKVTPKAIQKQVKLTYKSSNKKIATVSATGKIKAKKKGKATITVTAPNGKTLKVKLTVK
jgi:alpha-L-fucosidase 2